MIDRSSDTKRIGITALLPPELVYACGAVPVDLNNFVPVSTCHPASKLCAWTAIWRDMLVSGKMELDGIGIVAGGDCHNALVDGEKVAMSGIPAHYFFYPFLFTIVCTKYYILIFFSVFF